MLFREMTISLNNVACLLGLLVIGKSVCLPKDSDLSFLIDLLVISLDISHSEVRDKINDKRRLSTS